MGKDFVSVNVNGLNFKKAFDELISGKVVEASNLELFRKKPSIREVEDIDVGTSGTKESVFRLHNGDFVVVKKVVDINLLR